MRIESTSLQLASSYQRTSVTTRTERLRAWVDGEGSRAEDRRPATGTEGNDADKIEIEAYAARMRSLAMSQRTAFRGSPSDMPGPSSEPGVGAGKTSNGGNIKEKDDELELEGSGGTQLKLMKLILEKMTGRKVTIYKMKDPEAAEAAGEQAEKAAASGKKAPAEPEREGWGIDYERTDIKVETEASQFQAEGVVKTSDGKELSFSVEMAMSRQEVEMSHLRVRAGDAKNIDPLVINFGGTAAELSEQIMDFDLDSDGRNDKISFVRSGSGFIVNDTNGNGRVDDGKELFGPQSGDGFEELSRCDEDRNGWIDEGDSAYDTLRVWLGRDAEGRDDLRSLSAMNVGAISLSRVATPFTLQNAAGEDRGYVRATGVYLQEDGAAGTVQQIDLVG